MGARQLTKLLSRSGLPSTPKPKVERTKPPRRYQQGDLDSLCGIYAVVNAIVALCPEADEKAAMRLFRKLVRSLSGEVKRAIGTVYDGLDVGILEYLLMVAQRETERALGIGIKVKPFPGVRKHLTLTEFWEHAQAELGPRQVAILSLSGARDHWTVACAATDKVIRLRDSSDLRVLQRSRCTLERARTRYRINPQDCIMLKRV